MLVMPRLQLQIVFRRLLTLAVGDESKASFVDAIRRIGRLTAAHSGPMLTPCRIPSRHCTVSPPSSGCRVGSFIFLDLFSRLPLALSILGADTGLLSRGRFNPRLCDQNSFSTLVRPCWRKHCDREEVYLLLEPEQPKIVAES